MTHHVTPQGKFFCKGCVRHIVLSKRTSRYGKYCTTCKPKGEKK